MWSAESATGGRDHLGVIKMPRQRASNTARYPTNRISMQAYLKMRSKGTPRQGSAPVVTIDQLGITKWDSANVRAEAGKPQKPGSAAEMSFARLSGDIATAEAMAA